jgi:type IV secretory pathway VirD2 relaxase
VGKGVKGFANQRGLNSTPRGTAQDGSDLVISRDYISHNLRSRAEDLVSIELGPKPEHEIRSALAREVGAERWTRFDRAVRMATGDKSFIDLRPDNSGGDDPEVRRFAVGRLQKLERMASRHPQGRVSGWSPSRPSAPCAISACGATSSRPCIGPSPNAVRISAS